MPKPKLRGGSLVLYEQLRAMESLIERISDPCAAQQIHTQIISAKRSLSSDDRRTTIGMMDVIRDSLVDLFDMSSS